MRRSRKVCRRGSNFDNVFLDDEGGGGLGSKYHYKRAIISLSAFPRHADDGSTLKAGSVALRFFRGGVGTPVPL